MDGLPERAQFDATYLRRLREGDREIQRHFSEYFGTLLRVKLANGVRSWQMLLDARQETLARVLEAVRDGGIAHPEKLGAFVCAIANHVVWEYRRAENRYQREGDRGPEPIDERMEIERDLISAERKRLVERVLSGLSPKDRQVLRLLFLEECDKNEVCRRLGVTPEYLRVVLHRAKGRFRAKLGRKRREAANV